MSSVTGLARELTPPPRDVYPERADRAPDWLERAWGSLIGLAVTRAPALRARRLSRILRLVEPHAAMVARMDAAELEDCARDVRARLRRHGLRNGEIARAFALVRETAARAIGLSAFDVQLVGGFAMMRSMVAEMQTGEGKTLTAVFPAATAALAGIPVHVVTVNDYLAERDAAWMRPVYEALGLKLGVVVHGMDADARRAAYRCDVTYCTNKELAFDYLRDRLVLGEAGNLRLKMEGLHGHRGRADRAVMRGLSFAIVDEADSVLIDEARTPLIISGEAGAAEERERHEQALTLARSLTERVDFEIDRDERRIELTAPGKARLREIGEPLGGGFAVAILREEAVRQALAADHLYRRDEHYLVRGGAVQIIDEYTGRVMPDRFWSEGLHQLIEVKEDCPPSGRRATRGRITYQRFFRRYHRLAGMTGTAREVSAELWSVFRLPVAAIPTNRPVARTRLGDRFTDTAEEKWRLVAERASSLQRRGIPVLVGTRSVAASETLSALLRAKGVDHQVLSAAQDTREADVVGRAGEAGRITVATNMAGRGTDIVLGPGVAERGGLHVILTERHDARRIDRQLEGRCARQGDRGSVEAVLSFEDALLEATRGTVIGRLLLSLAGRHGGVAARAAFVHAQLHAERSHSRMRRDLLKLDESLGRTLAFSGAME